MSKHPMPERPAVGDTMDVIPMFGESYEAPVARVKGLFVWVGEERFHSNDDRVGDSGWITRPGRAIVRPKGWRSPA
jgi:hypothetical protein